MNSKRYSILLSTESLLLAVEIITTLGEVKEVSGLPIRVFHIVIRKEKKKGYWFHWESMQLAGMIQTLRYGALSGFHIIFIILYNSFPL
jgi:hypothetical protein